MYIVFFFSPLASIFLYFTFGTLPSYPFLTPTYFRFICLSFYIFFYLSTHLIVYGIIYQYLWNYLFIYLFIYQSKSLRENPHYTISDKIIVWLLFFINLWKCNTFIETSFRHPISLMGLEPWPPAFRTGALRLSFWQQTTKYVPVQLFKW